MSELQYEHGIDSLISENRLSLKLYLDFKGMSPNLDQSLPAVVFKEGQVK